MNKWHNRFINLAKEVSSWSKDPSTAVGCVYVNDKKQILSVGFNGLPRGIKDSDEILNNKELKYKYIVHAEQNGIYNACFNGVTLNGSTVYVYGLPVCSDCAKGIIQVGVCTVVIQKPNMEINPKWADSWTTSIQMFNEAGITLILI